MTSNYNDIYHKYYYKNIYYNGIYDKCFFVIR